MGCFDMSFPHLISVTKLCTSGNGKIRPWVYLALTVFLTGLKYDEPSRFLCGLADPIIRLKGKR